MACSIPNLVLFVVHLGLQIRCSRRDQSPPALIRIERGDKCLL
jgi:hypothetical protein